MSDQRGLTMLELLIASLVIGIVAAGFTSAYLMTSRAYVDSNTRAALQRQGTLAVEEISRRLRSARSAPGSGISTGLCNGRANALQVDTPDGRFCYYAEDTGAPDTKLCEFTPAGACRNLLAGGLARIALMRQPTPSDPNCPEEVAAGAPCLVASARDSNQADVAFTLVALDADGSPSPYGLRPIPFRISITCRWRNC